MGAIDNRTNQPVSKQTTFLRLMRCVSVFAVTIWLLVLLSDSLSTNEWHLITWMVLTVFYFFITIPVLGFWIYSFIKAVRTRTKTNNILLFSILQTCYYWEQQFIVLTIGIAMLTLWQNIMKWMVLG